MTTETKNDKPEMVPQLRPGIIRNIEIVTVHTQDNTTLEPSMWQTQLFSDGVATQKQNKCVLLTMHSINLLLILEISNDP